MPKRKGKSVQKGSEGRRTRQKREMRESERPIDFKGSKKKKKKGKK